MSTSSAQNDWNIMESVSWQNEDLKELDFFENRQQMVQHLESELGEVQLQRSEQAEELP